MAVDEEKLLRKLRKKLRQIEHLETLDRELNQEESDKVERKTEIRIEVQSILGKMKRKSQDESTLANIADKSSVSSSPSSSPKKSRANAEALAQEEQLEISVPIGDPAESEEGPVEPDSSQLTPPSPVSGPEPTASSSSTSPDTASTLQVTRSSSKSSVTPAWKKKAIHVSDLDGHEDLVEASAIEPEEGQIAMSGARDTSILIWDLASQELIGSLRGHTGSVTGLVFVSKEARKTFSSEASDNDLLAVSASMDCSIKLWNVTKKKLIKSIYTYNPIRSLAFLPSHNMVVTGSLGGKIELYDFAKTTSVAAANAHDDVIMAMDARGKYLATGARDGEIKVWQVSPSLMSGQICLQCLYVSERVQPVSEEQGVHLRCIYSLALLANSAAASSEPSYLAYGDAGHNIKVLDWRRGSLLYKIPNHTADAGLTDCLRATSSGEFLIASSYDLDQGKGHLNLFSVAAAPSSSSVPLKYVSSWSDCETGRIFGLSVCETDKSLTCVTGGKHLKVWRTLDKRRQLPTDRDAVILSPMYLPLTVSEVIDSGSSEEDSEDDSEENQAADQAVSSSLPESETQGSNRSQWWCTIM